MGSVSWRRGNRLIITGAQVYAQRRVADGRKWLGALCRKDVTALNEISCSYCGLFAGKPAPTGVA
ncbi:protein of unknown function [Pseudomonas inefficax]|uniref:Uncharacterized protein n=1 Tax=Pseudomonas inefficax TaxID=2078786 RepID=A0AAQ1SWB6_9PSED|nr:protein of unknown function [Pseudomonas inefficax]